MSTLDIKFIPLTNENLTNYYGYLCDIDNFKILFDCGWNFQMDSYIVEQLEKYSDNIDLILISGSSLKHVGCLPYIYNKLSLKCPIYMTQPVCQASKLTLYDYYQSLYNLSNDIPFTLDDIDNVIDQVIRVRYLQTVYLKGKGQGITIMALNSGMTLGSCMWHITKDNEGDIIYAVQINHKKQNHLNEAMIHGLIKPFIFITDASNHTTHAHSKKIKIQNLTKEILQILNSNNGNILIFSDSCGQIIEFLFILSNILRQNNYTCVDVILASHVAHHILKLVTSNIEYLNEKLMKRMESGVFNFLGLLNLYTCQTIAEIDHVKSARIIITSDINMDYNIGLELFNRMASDPYSLIIYTILPDIDSLAYKVINSHPNSEISFTISKRIQLVGQELTKAFDAMNENIVSTTTNPTFDDYLSSTSENEDNIDFMDSLPNENNNNNNSINNGDDDHNSSLKLSYTTTTFNDKQNDNDYVTNKNSKLDHLLDLFEYGSNKTENNQLKYSLLKPLQTHLNSRFRKPYDVYGEFYKHEEFIKNIIQEKTIISYDDKCMKNAYDHIEVDITKYPSKIVTSQQTIQLESRIICINLNCVIDYVSQTRMIESIQPNHLIVISDNRKNIEMLYTSLINIIESNSSNNIRQINFHSISPSSSNKTLEICGDKQISYARIKDNDLESLEFKPCSNVSISWIEILDKYYPNHCFSYDHPIVRLANINNMTYHKSIYINNIKINEFKIKLENIGINARIDNGILYCADNRVKIFKTASNEINIEACICEEYFEIKNLLYEQFCMI